MKIQEATFGKPQSVDRENMIIRGAKLIGKVSKNGREYSQDALDQLKGMYEGISCNVDHDRTPGSERSMVAGFGIIENVQNVDGGLVGDIHYLSTHPLANVILERAERMPKSFGMSHNAEGKVVKRGGKLIVENVATVHSVDIVGDPATTNGLFESLEGYDMKATTIKEILNTVPKDTPGANLLQEAMDGGQIAANTPVEVAPEAKAGDQVKAAFRAAVIEAFDNDSLDTAATIARIKEILKAQEKLKPKAEAPTDPAPAADPASDPVATPAADPASNKVAESTKRAVMAEAKCLLLESGCTASPEQVRAIAKADEADQKVLLESWKQEEGSPRPGMSPPKNTEGGAVEFSRDSKKFASQLR